MKNIPEINHCTPNPKAFWCSRCTAHNPYDYSVTSSTKHHTTEHFKCKACGVDMFRPAQIQPWVYGFIVCAILMTLLGFFCLLDQLRVVGRNYEEGLMLISFGFAAFTGLIGAIMTYHQRKWRSWLAEQKRKSAKALELEAFSHPFQPEYEQDEHFTGWARQFLSEEEVDLLHQTYGDKKAEGK